jgi:hypothetical protein
VQVLCFLKPVLHLTLSCRGFQQQNTIGTPFHCLVSSSSYAPCAHCTSHGGSAAAVPSSHPALPCSLTCLQNMRGGLANCLKSAGVEFLDSSDPLALDAASEVRCKVEF